MNYLNFLMSHYLEAYTSPRLKENMGSKKIREFLKYLLLLEKPNFANKKPQNMRINKYTNN